MQGAFAFFDEELDLRAPHYITRRYAELLASMLVLMDKFPRALKVPSRSFLHVSRESYPFLRSDLGAETPSLFASLTRGHANTAHFLGAKVHEFAASPHLSHQQLRSRRLPLHRTASLSHHALTFHT